LFVNGVFIITLFLIVLFFLNKEYRKAGTSYQKYLLIGVFLMHFSMCFFHWNWIAGKQLDVHFFYNTALNTDNWLEVFGVGSRFIAFLIYPLVNIGVSYLGLFVLFSSISLVGYINLYRLLNLSIEDGLYKLTSSILLLLPSVHFWTSFFGKEALIFPLMIFLLYSVKEKKYKNPVLYIALLLILFIRPYLFFLILGGFGLALITEKINLKSKLLILFSTILIGFLTLPILIKFLKITSINSFIDNYGGVAKYASENGASSINLLESNYFERIFLVLFRPAFYEVKNIYQGVISLENIFVFIIIIIICFSFKKVKIKEIYLDVKFVLLSAVFVILFLSIYMYNFGLASRMRVMFIPYLIYGLLKLRSGIKNV